MTVEPGDTFLFLYKNEHVVSYIEFVDDIVNEQVIFTRLFFDGIVELNRTCSRVVYERIAQKFSEKL